VMNFDEMNIDLYGSCGYCALILEISWGVNKVHHFRRDVVL